MAVDNCGCECYPQITEKGVLTNALSSLAANTATVGSLIQQRFQQLGADSASMWSVAMTTPTVNAAMGQRIASESGSGVERRLPDTGGGNT